MKEIAFAPADAEDRRDLIDLLRRQLEELIGSARDRATQPVQVELDRENLDRLRSLGYMGGGAPPAAQRVFINPF